MTDADVKRARRPRGHGGAVSSSACKGSRISPLNPSGDKTKSRILRCRVTQAEFSSLQKKSALSQTTMAQLLREALGLVDARRRKPVPRVDPELIRSVSRIGTNINQIARWLNSTSAAGHVNDIDAMLVASRLVAVDRSLNNLIETTTLSSSQAANKRGEQQC